MTDRTTWLRVQLNEDEQIAEKAAAMRFDLPADAPWESARILADHIGGSSRAVATHRVVAVFADPRRVLAVTGAHRRILDLHERTLCGGHSEPWTPHGDACTYGCEVCGGDEYPCETVRLLIEAYAGCPGFPEEEQA